MDKWNPGNKLTRNKNETDWKYILKTDKNQNEKRTKKTIKKQPKTNVNKSERIKNELIVIIW